jgi:hypothetical protein
LNGSYGPFSPPFYLPFNTLEDVTAAHCLAMVTPTAQGRYILSEYLWTKDFYALLLPEYSKYSIPKGVAPLLAIKIFAPLVGVSSDIIEACSSPWKPKLSRDKAERELGLQFRPTKQGALEMAERLIEIGLVPRKK